MPSTSPKHALYSGSTAAIWTWCPWSPMISKLAPPDEAGTAAKRGVKLHGIAEDWLTAALDGQEYDPPILDGISEVRFYVEYVLSEDALGQRPLIEQYVGDRLYTYGGIADAVMLREVVDFKTGDVVVSARGNLQLEFLAWCNDMTEATLTIVQKGIISKARQQESGAIFQDAIIRGTTEKPQLKRGPKCSRCKGKSVCPAWTGNAEDANGF